MNTELAIHALGGLTMHLLLYSNLVVPRALDPAYVRGVKHAGAVKSTIAVSTMHLAKCMNC